MKESDQILNELRQINSNLLRLIRIVDTGGNQKHTLAPSIGREIEEKIRAARREAEDKLSSMKIEKRKMHT